LKTITDKRKSTKILTARRPCHNQIKNKTASKLDGEKM
jgi:hypothetical protein